MQAGWHAANFLHSISSEVLDELTGVGRPLPPPEPTPHVASRLDDFNGRGEYDSGRMCAFLPSQLLPI